MKVETKFKISDKPFFIHDGAVVQKEIIAISACQGEGVCENHKYTSFEPPYIYTEVKYHFAGGLIILSEKVFTSKEELLASL